MICTKTQIKLENYTFRPKLSRSCRCIIIQGHGYESVVDRVSILSHFQEPSKSITIGNVYVHCQNQKTYFVCNQYVGKEKDFGSKNQIKNILVEAPYGS